MSATIAEVGKENLHTVQELAAHYVNGIKEEVSNPVLYDLGCGKRRLDGFRGVDLYADTDVRADLLNAEWDFTPDNSVDMLYSSHFVEHVQDLNTFMTRAWRKLKNKGLFLINTPYGYSIRAWQDPDHKRPIFRETYCYFSKDWRERNQVDHYEGQSDFEILQFWPCWNRKYAVRAENNPELAESYFTINCAIDDLMVMLRAKK